MTSWLDPELRRRPSGTVRTMQTWDAITSRRNVRNFEDRPIPAADLDRILEAGWRSPSSQNWQPWDFILVTDRDQLRELSHVFSGAYHVADSAATIAVVGPVTDNAYHRAQLDLGQAVMSITLAATDLGIGSCHAGVQDMALARRVLGLPGRPRLRAADLARVPGRPAVDARAKPEAPAIQRGRAPRPLVAGESAHASPPPVVQEGEQASTARDGKPCHQRA